MSEEVRRINMAIIAGAAAALDYKEKNPNAFTPEIMQFITDKAHEIREKIDDPF